MSTFKSKYQIMVMYLIRLLSLLLMGFCCLYIILFWTSFFNREIGKDRITLFLAEMTMAYPFRSIVCIAIGIVISVVMWKFSSNSLLKNPSPMG